MSARISVVHSPTSTTLTRDRILQEPSPLILAATHMSMQRHFDMNELCQHLVSTTGNKGKTKVSPRHVILGWGRTANSVGLHEPSL